MTTYMQSAELPVIFAFDDASVDEVSRAALEAVDDGRLVLVATSDVGIVLKFSRLTCIAVTSGNDEAEMRKDIVRTTVDDLFRAERA